MNHPSSFISAESAHFIRSLAAEAELSGSLHPDQLGLIYNNRWFNLFVPKEYGGLGLTLLQALQTEEGLAYADGSTGWTVTLCSGANWFIGFLEKDVAKQIFKDFKVCLAGSGKPSGIAKLHKQGYEITGYWRYATGAPHATIFTANCQLEKDGIILTDEAGNPQTASFWFKKEEVTIHRNWSSTGMIATASESFEVKELFVPYNRSFLISSTAAVLDHPVYLYPFLQFAETTLAINISGMAMRFLDLCGPLFVHNHRGEEITMMLEKKLTSSIKKLHQSRKTFYTNVEYSWQDLLLNEKNNEHLLKQVSTSSRYLAHTARILTESLYPYCGLAAADPLTEINRVWRNIHTASQHSLLNFTKA